jgi:hypothetical protein
MAIRDLFIVRTRNKLMKGEAVAAAAAPSDAVGVFITPQSLMSFPVASSAVVVVWALSKRLFPAWGASEVVPLAASFLVGLVVFLITVSDKKAAPKSGTGWLIAVTIALINCLFLASAALGILR